MWTVIYNKYRLQRTDLCALKLAPAYNKDPPLQRAVSFTSFYSL